MNKTAKEMFEENDFHLKTNNKQYLTYEKTIIYKRDIGCGRTRETKIVELIVFDKLNKRIGGTYNGFPKKYWFDFEIIIAINKQIEELCGDDILKNNGNK